MKNKILIISSLIISLFILVGCDDDNTGIVINDHTIEVILPEELQLANVSPSGISVTLTNVNTGTKISQITDSEGKI